MTWISGTVVNIYHTPSTLASTVLTSNFCCYREHFSTWVKISPGSVVSCAWCSRAVCSIDSACGVVYWTLTVGEADNFPSPAPHHRTPIATIYIENVTRSWPSLSDDSTVTTCRGPGGAKRKRGFGLRPLRLSRFGLDGLRQWHYLCSACD